VIVSFREFMDSALFPGEPEFSAGMDFKERLLVSGQD
jgi:hypothetical protein